MQSLSCAEEYKPKPPNPNPPIMSESTYKRSEKEQFLDHYFQTRLRHLIEKISEPDLVSRRKHQDEILDLMMNLAEEYQAVMIEREGDYWESIEMWKDEISQRLAIEWVNKTLDGDSEIN